jgi:hypothetical protein
MPVKDADPGAQEMDSAFAEAMAGPAKPRGPEAPPAVDHEAPLGRDEHGEPLAPYGFKQDGSVRRSPAGRRPRDPDSAARTGPASPDKGSTPGDTPRNSQDKLTPKDFCAGLMDAGESLWFGGSVVARVGPQIPLVGKFIPGRKLSATMAVFDSERPRLAAALNEAAQHDARARKLAEKLASGDAGWALTCMFMVAPFTGAVAAIWQGDEALKERELPSLSEMATQNEAAMDQMLARISQQMKLAQELAATQAQQAMEAAQASQNGQVASV